jgi:hypothetical protein
MRVPERCLDKLRAAGLLVSDPYVPNHLAYPDGVMAAKPASIRGNSIPGYESYWGVGGPLVDAPSLVLHCDGDKWLLTSHDYVPGPGPGDFVNEWDSPDQAIADILAFFFGDPSRMEVKRRRAGYG